MELKFSGMIDMVKTSLNQLFVELWPKGSGDMTTSFFLRNVVIIRRSFLQG